MANKVSSLELLKKGKKAAFEMGCSVHNELLKASDLFIDETVANVTKAQKIAGKVIKKGEPIVEKQIEITLETIDGIANQAAKGGKRALKLFGMTKQYNALTKNITKKVEALPTTDALIDNVKEYVDDAKEYVANAKSDVEQTITKATKSIKKVATNLEATAKKTVDAKATKVTKTAKATVKSAKPAAKKTVKKVAKKVTTAKAKVTTTAKNAKPVAKKVVAKKTVAPKATAKPTAKPTAVTTAPATPKKAIKANPTTDLTNIKGIGPSLAAIMSDNGIKTISELQSATPAALKIVATKAGNRYKTFDTNLWVEAAKASK